MSIINHIQKLHQKHAQLEISIHEERAHPHPDDSIIADLKHQKLKIKDELQSLDSDYRMAS